MANCLYQDYNEPTRSRGISRSSDPCLRKTSPAVCDGLIPIPSSVIIALVAAFCLNSSAAYFNTAILKTNTLNGNFGSDVSVILKVTFDDDGAVDLKKYCKHLT
ncbi:asparagine-linked glycosylation protein [Blomia tropicalis]|nr:asparagine-linked glycosylation protein [Blomia tropicalis]